LKSEGILSGYNGEEDQMKFKYLSKRVGKGDSESHKKNSLDAPPAIKMTCCINTRTQTLVGRNPLSLTLLLIKNTQDC